ncbi:MAG: methionyl-tRNA formyltransferase [Candidatus Latescibacterota bacterium]
MRIVFMGTPEFACSSLERLLDSRHEIVGVVTQPDRPRGRGQQSLPTPIKRLGQERGLPVWTPSRLRERAFLELLKSLQPDLLVVVAFRMLPPQVLAIARLGAINVHPSLLPKYRGAAPIQWAVIRGEQETGVTTFCINCAIDCGDMLLQRIVPIGAEETAGELHDRLMEIGADLLLESVELLDSGCARPKSQPSNDASSAPRLGKEDGRIDWSEGAAQINNRIRGTHPFPGAFTCYKGTILKVHRARPVPSSAEGLPGEILVADGKQGITVVTGSGALLLIEVQPAGKKRMSSAAFVRGYRIGVGERLGT